MARIFPTCRSVFSRTRFEGRAVEFVALLSLVAGGRIGTKRDSVRVAAGKVLGDAILKQIAQDLVKAVRGNLTIDWTVRDNVRANLRVIIKRILRKHGYPPDKTEKAV